MSEETEWCYCDENTNNLKGTSIMKLEVMGDMIYNLGESRFDIEKTKKKQVVKEPSRRRREIIRLKQEFRSLSVDEKKVLRNCLTKYVRS